MAHRICKKNVNSFQGDLILLYILGEFYGSFPGGSMMIKGVSPA